MERIQVEVENIGSCISMDIGRKANVRAESTILTKRKRQEHITFSFQRFEKKKLERRRKRLYQRERTQRYQSVLGKSNQRGVLQV